MAEQAHNERQCVKAQVLDTVALLTTGMINAMRQGQDLSQLQSEGLADDILPYQLDSDMELKTILSQAKQFRVRLWSYELKAALELGLTRAGVQGDQEEIAYILLEMAPAIATVIYELMDLSDRIRPNKQQLNELRQFWGPGPEVMALRLLSRDEILSQDDSDNPDQLELHLTD